MCMKRDTKLTKTLKKRKLQTIDYRRKTMRKQLYLQVLLHLHVHHSNRIGIPTQLSEHYYLIGLSASVGVQYVGRQLVELLTEPPTSRSAPIPIVRADIPRRVARFAPPLCF